jgi:hypothetical protein
VGAEEEEEEEVINYVSQPWKKLNYFGVGPK